MRVYCPSEDLWGEQAPMSEAYSIAEAGIVTDIEGLLVRERPPAPPRGKPRLLDRVRDAVRTRHLSPKTEKAYVGWTKRFVVFQGMRHPEEMREREINQFMSYLAVKRKVSPATQKQALSALIFLYKKVLDMELGWVRGFIRAKQAIRLPVVLTREEVAAVLAHLSGLHWLMASLLYGSGMRLLECLRMRIKDVDFQRNEIILRDAKGKVDPSGPSPNEGQKSPWRPHQARTPPARRGSTERCRLRGATLRSRSQVSASASRMGLAVGLPGNPFLCRACDR